MAASRNLTLTEELEKLEQSITLTLQEIDHNFSRAHRIVTSSILPIVQNYATHSEAVWSGSKFWKEFFEASANISLTGYEEAEEDEDEDETQNEYGDGDDTEDVTQTQTQTQTTKREDEDATVTTADSETPQRPTSRGLEAESDSSLLESPSVSVATAAAPHGSTPRARGKQPAAATKSQKPPARPAYAGIDDDDEITSSFADYPSPYEALRQDITGNTRTAPKSQPSTSSARGTADPPKTPSATTNTATTPQTRPSPFGPTTAQKHHQPQNTTTNDPLLHRILDKNYRIAATPLTSQKNKTSPNRKPKASQASQSFAQQQQQQPKKNTTTTRSTLLDLDSSPFSPALQAPALRAEIFGNPSPVRSKNPLSTYSKPGAPARGGAVDSNAPRTPRIPGVSVQRPRAQQQQQQNFGANARSGFTPGTATAGGGREDTTRKTLFTDTMTSQAQAQTQAQGPPLQSPGLLAPPPKGTTTHPTQTQTQTQSQSQAKTTAPKSTTTSTTIASRPNLSWDSSDSDDDATFGGMSPPKTIALDLPRMGGRVVQTPAREAAGRIVGDLLRGAGGRDGGEDSITDTDDWVVADKGQKGRFVTP